MDNQIHNSGLTRAYCHLARRSLWRVGFILAPLLLLGVVTAVAQPISVGGSLPMVEVALPDINGLSTAIGALPGESGLVVTFWAKSCPWIDRYEDRFVSIVRDYETRGVAFVAVNSNDPVAYPEDARTELLAQAEKGKYSFRYLVDADGSFANALGARRTPEVFVFNSDRKLVYSGAIDDSPAIASAVGNPHLRNVLDALIAGTPVDEATTNAIGCTIKFAPH